MRNPRLTMPGDRVRRPKRTVHWNRYEDGLTTSRGRHNTPLRRVIDGRRTLAAKHISFNRAFLLPTVWCCVSYGLGSRQALRFCAPDKSC
jgi:hypothetical protein